MSGTNGVTPTEPVNFYDARQKEIDSIYESAMAGATSVRNETIAKAQRTRDQGYESAGILYERMKKYLPLKQKIAGTSGMGISQSEMNDVGNTLMNQRAAITRNFNDQVDTANAKLYQTANEAAAVHSSATQELMGEQDSAVRSVMTELDSYSSREDALTALGLIMDTSDPRYAGYEATINEHFTDRENKDQRNALVDALLSDIGQGVYKDKTDDEVIAMLTEIYEGDTESADYIKDLDELDDALYNYSESSYADYFDEIDRMLALYENDPDQMQARLEEYLAEDRLKDSDREYFEAAVAAARDDHATAAQDKAREDFVTQLGVLADSVLTTDEDFTKLWEEYKDQLSPSAQKVYEKVINTYVNDTSRDIARDEAERERDQYMNDLLLLDEAEKQGYDDLDTYKKAVIDGDAKFNGYTVISGPVDKGKVGLPGGSEDFRVVRKNISVWGDDVWTWEELTEDFLNFEGFNDGKHWRSYICIDGEWYMAERPSVIKGGSRK